MGIFSSQPGNIFFPGWEFFSLAWDFFSPRVIIVTPKEIFISPKENKFSPKVSEDAAGDAEVQYGEYLDAFDKINVFGVLDD